MSTSIKKIITYVLLIFTGVIFLFPLLWSLISSIKPENDIVSYPPRWIPANVTLDNYVQVLEKYPFLKWGMNSIITTISATLLILVISSMAAYAFGRLNFPGKKILFTVVLSMLLIPMQAYIVPLFFMMSTIKLLNSYFSLILVAGANVTSVFILTSFFKGIPNELEEAARIDGCNEFTIFAQIMLPLSKAALSTVAILTFIANWNNFLWPLIAIRDNGLKTLPVGIAQFMGSAGSNAQFQYGPSLAGACMAIVPSIIVFLSLQRYFVEGIANSGIKG